MTGEERKRYDDDVKFRNAVCEHGSQRRKCNTCDLLCEQHDNAALRARIEDVEGMAKFMCELSYPATGTGWAGTVESARMAWRERARAVSAYLKEGK